MKRRDIGQQSEMESEETCGFQEFSLLDTKKMWAKTFEPVEYVNECQSWPLINLIPRRYHVTVLLVRRRRLVRLQASPIKWVRSSRGSSLCKECRSIHHVSVLRFGF